MGCMHIQRESRIEKAPKAEKKGEKRQKNNHGEDHHETRQSGLRLAMARIELLGDPQSG